MLILERSCDRQPVIANNSSSVSTASVMLLQVMLFLFALKTYAADHAVSLHCERVQEEAKEKVEEEKEKEMGDHFHDRGA